MSAAPPLLSSSRKSPRREASRADPSGEETPLTGTSGSSGDDDPLEGEWLFKQNDMVLGPVSAQVLLERIKQGELGTETPIARDGQPFAPLGRIAAFREAHQAATERQKREAEERAHQAAVRRARTLRVVILAVIVLVPAAGGAVAGRTVMIERPWDDTPKWMAKVPPLVDLPQRAAEAKTPEPKLASLTPSAPEPEEPEADEPDRPDRPDQPRKGKPKRGRDEPKKSDGRSDPKKEESAPPEPEQKGPLPEQITNEQAIAPLKNAAVKDALKGCFKAELDSNPDVPAEIRLSYTVTEDGRAANVNLDNRELRGRPVVECVRKALAIARWPRFTGERKNVSVPFTLKKPKPPGAK
jgi:hypothetical protein